MGGGQTTTPEEARADWAIVVAALAEANTSYLSAPTNASATATSIPVADEVFYTLGTVPRDEWGSGGEMSVGEVEEAVTSDVARQLTLGQKDAVRTNNDATMAEGMDEDQ